MCHLPRRRKLCGAKERSFDIRRASLRLVPRKRHEVAATAKLAQAKCAECHDQEVQEFEGSAHGRAAKVGDPDTPSCQSCHGAVYEIRGSAEGGTPVAKQQVAATCAKCHSNLNFLTRHRMSIAHPVEQYLNRVHGQAVAQGKNAASCSDCHGTHRILRASDAQSSVNHWRVAATCAACHQEIAKTYLESVHGQAMKAGMQDAPVCTDCPGERFASQRRECFRGDVRPLSWGCAACAAP